MDTSMTLLRGMHPGMPPSPDGIIQVLFGSCCFLLLLILILAH